MVLKYQEAIRRNAKWEIIKNGAGLLADVLMDRSAYAAGTYNPIDYCGTPKQGGNYATNRVGIFGPDTLTDIVEGTTPITFSQNRQIIRNTDFYRRVNVSGQNVWFINCRFNGTPTDGTPPMTATSSQVGARFTSCTFSPLAPQWQTYTAQGGLGGGLFEFCDFYGGTDGFCNNSTGGWPQQWTIDRCAFHDLLYMSPFPNFGIQDNASHTDCVQWSGGKLKIVGSALYSFFDMSPLSQAPEPNLYWGTGSLTDSSNQPPYHFFGNKYVDTVNVPAGRCMPEAKINYPSIYATSCVMLSPYIIPVTYFEFDKNYVQGASDPINVNEQYWTVDGGYQGPFLLTNNRIGKNHRWGRNGTNRLIIERSNLHSFVTASGNVDLDSGSLVTDIFSNG